MSATNGHPAPPAILGQALIDAIKQAVREELNSQPQAQKAELLTPEQLADRLNVPRSWVYEQSRAGKIPTHRFGRYIRFRLDEVIASREERLTANRK